jgi:hypothetical protein
MTHTPLLNVHTPLGAYHSMVDQDTGVSPTATAHDTMLSSPEYPNANTMYQPHWLTPPVAHHPHHPPRHLAAGPTTPRILPATTTGAAAEALVTLGTPGRIPPTSALLSPPMGAPSTAGAPGGLLLRANFPTPEGYQQQESLDDVREAVRLLDSLSLSKLKEYDALPDAQRKRAYGSWYQLLLSPPPELKLLSLVDFPFTHRVSEVVSREMPDLCRVPVSHPQLHANFGHQATQAPATTGTGVSDGFHLPGSSSWDRSHGSAPQHHQVGEDEAADASYESQLYQQVPEKQPRRLKIVTATSATSMFEQMQRLKLQKRAEGAAQRQRKHAAEDAAQKKRKHDAEADGEAEEDSGEEGNSAQSEEDEEEEDEEPGDPAWPSEMADMDDMDDMDDEDDDDDSDQDSTAYRDGEHAKSTTRTAARTSKPKTKAGSTGGNRVTGGGAKKKPTQPRAPRADGSSRHVVVGRPIIDFDAHPELCEDFREGDALFALSNGLEISCRVCLWLEPVDLAPLIREGATPRRRRVFVYATEFAEKFFGVSNNHARALNPIPDSGMCKIANSNFISANGVREAVKLCKQFRESKVRDAPEQKKYVKDVLQAVCGPMERFESGQRTPEFATVMTSDPVKATTSGGGGGAEGGKPARKRSRKLVKHEADDDDDDDDVPMGSTPAAVLPYASSSAMPMLPYVPAPASAPALPDAPMPPFQFDAKQMLTMFLNSGVISREAAAEVLRERTDPQQPLDREAVVRAASLVPRI